MKKIFFSIRDEDKRAAVERVCAQQQVEVHYLEAKDVNRTVAQICGVPAVADRADHKSAPVLYALPEIMLFFGIDDKALDDFLDAYKAAGIARIQRKAVVTPTNLGWTLYELAEALGEEIAVNENRPR